MRIVIAMLLFAFQLGAIVYARYVPSRYFCWAPYDIQTDYVATSIVNGHKLTPAEFRHRYRRPEKGSDNRSPENLTDMFKGVEEKQALRGDKAVIVVKYRINGKDLREWDWPLVPSDLALESDR